MQMMSLPYFHTAILDNKDGLLFLNEETSRHITGVLRMQKDEEVLLTNGAGVKARAIIVDDHRKKCVVKILAIEKEDAQQPKIAIAISLLKNTARFEWFLEKATEIGVNEIFPLLCDRTEKEKFRFDRMNNILVSAMLQSQQCWMPALSEPVAMKEILAKSYAQKFIAHCLPNEKIQLADRLRDSKPSGAESALILIGPEGDFTPAEIETAIDHNFTPVALGDTRLRTETAGIVAATLLCIG